MRILAIALVAWVGLCTAVRADTVELVSGEKLEGEILDRNADYVEMEHPILGRIQIPIEDIEPAEQPKPGLFGTTFLEGWNKALSAGLSGSDGKSNEISANADLSLKREVARHRSSYVARFNFDRSDGDTSEDRFFTKYVHDFLFPDADFFVFLAGSYLLDTQLDWLHRVSGEAGVGHRILETDEWGVLARLGGGASRTLNDRRGPSSTADDPVRTEANALVGVEATWRYREGQSLSLNSLYLHDVSDLSGLRSESRGEWKIDVALIEGLGLKLGTSFIYDSHEQGKLRRDLRYYANIGYDF